MMVRDAAAADAARIAEIYDHYVLTTTITFEEEAVGAAGMAARVAAVAAEHCWLVAEEDGRVLGYAYLDRWKARCAYRNSAETSVYVDKDAVGRGLGTALCGELLRRARAMGMHAVIAGIALPNAASVALHERLGFEQVAHFKETGFKFGRWIDVGYWELLLG